MNIASIDIGTNTVLLLIATIDQEHLTFKPIINAYKVPRIGRGLIKGNSIPDKNVSQLLDVLKEYSFLIAQNNCNITLVTATNALRIATNADNIVEKIKDAIGYDLKIVTGEEEAYLSFLGASTSLPEIERKCSIDVGGGSTEIIIGTSGTIEFKESLQIGAVSLTERYINNDPPTKFEINIIQEFIKQKLSGLNKKLFNDLTCIAVAGTPTTLSCIIKNLKTYNENVIEGSTITIKDLNNIIILLTKMTAEKIKSKYGKIVEGREDILLSGSIIIHEFMKCVNLDKVYVSGRGIRYGAVIDYLNKQSLTASKN
ncbi:MAG: hypothetical protein A2V66_03450 [Ignavibacteria bacterium RBG_13_36_8]|nr:MAG: hypothetical protein A2V66_03450 [Ignavibacteria bacterium RBG_13_36_8]